MSVVLVTGGSSGIGAALVRAAAADGQAVLIGFDTGKARATALRDGIRATGGAADIIHLPLHAPDRLRAALEGIAPQDAPGTLALCGWPAPVVAPFSRQRPEDFAHQQAALTGCHTLIAAAWRLWWRKAGGGHVIAMLTDAIEPPVAPHMASYVAAKGALRSLLDAAASELGPAGLRVSVAAPGYVETAMLNSFDARLLDRARAAQPDETFLSPERVAAVLVGSIGAPPPAGTTEHLPI